MLQAQKAQAKVEEQKQRQDVLEAQKAQAKVEEQKRLEAEAARKAERRKSARLHLKPRRVRQRGRSRRDWRLKQPAKIRRRKSTLGAASFAEAIGGIWTRCG